MAHNEHQNFVHQAYLFDPNRAGKVVIIGVGSVGSLVANFLAKAGVSDIEVWDHDCVESYNTPMSLYRPQDVGRPKVSAIAEIVKENSGVTPKVHQKKYTGEPLRNCYVVSCVDGMPTRRMIWEQVKMQTTVGLFCDTRLNSMYVEVYANQPCRKEDIERYEMTLFDDEDAVRQTCGTHGVIFVSSRAAQIAAAGLMVFWMEGRKQWRVAERCDRFTMV